ncbi:unnamed protein product, partial [Prunus brigantina]
VRSEDCGSDRSGIFESCEDCGSDRRGIIEACEDGIDGIDGIDGSGMGVHLGLEKVKVEWWASRIQELRQCWRLYPVWGVVVSILDSCPMSPRDTRTMRSEEMRIRLTKCPLNPARIAAQFGDFLIASIALDTHVLPARGHCVGDPLSPKLILMLSQARRNFQIRRSWASWARLTKLGQYDPSDDRESSDVVLPFEKLGVSEACEDCGSDLLCISEACEDVTNKILGIDGMLSELMEY